jgi:hypothetical protein
MIKQIKPILFSITAIALFAITGCKKGTFDINSPNPNVPSTVPPQFSLSAALKESADLMYDAKGSSTANGQDFLQYWMGYWAVSGDYIPSNSVVLYQINTDYFSGNWDNGYLNLKNYDVIETSSITNASPNYEAIAKIMKAFVYQRIVDLYNDAPYTNSLNGGADNFPTYDKSADIYKSLISKVDSAIDLINGASADAKVPGSDDVLFGGDMGMWLKFANTVKLKLLMRTTVNPVMDIKGELSGLTTDDFLSAGEDAAVNPGYQNVAGQQSPQWADVGFVPAGQPTGNNSYFRSCSYAVNFYQANNDPRDAYFYAPNTDGVIKGRAFGSTNLEHNTEISGVNGKGIIKSASQDAVILPAFESLFLQAEAVQRGYLSGTASDLYSSAVTESFRLLGVSEYESAATTYISQAANANTNFAYSSDKIKTIITQKWAALNAYDPLESYSDWRRLKIPADLPVSIYPGNTAPHIPYRLLYPSSEYNYNGSNANAEGSIDPLSSKIFWMP